MSPQVCSKPAVRLDHRYAVFKPLRDVGEGELPSSVIFLVDADQLSALVVLANYARKGVENVDEILEVPHVDIMFIGAIDLTLSLGRPGDHDHPEVTKAMTRLVEAAKDHGKVAGMYTPSYQQAEYQ